MLYTGGFVAGYCTWSCYPPKCHLPDGGRKCEVQWYQDVRAEEWNVIPWGRRSRLEPHIWQSGRGPYPRGWLGAWRCWQGRDVALRRTFRRLRAWRATTTRKVLSGLPSWGLSSSLLQIGSIRRPRIEEERCGLGEMVWWQLHWGIRQRDISEYVQHNEMH